MLMTTTEKIPGHEIERVLGLIEASSWSSFGGARRKIERKAQGLSANAIVGMGYAAGSGFSPAVVFGTAVVLRPEPTT